MGLKQDEYGEGYETWREQRQSAIRTNQEQHEDALTLWHEPTQECKCGLQDKLNHQPHR